MKDQPVQNTGQPHRPPYAPNFAQPAATPPPAAPPPPPQTLPAQPAQEVLPVPPGAPEYIASAPAPLTPPEQQSADTESPASTPPSDGQTSNHEASQKKEESKAKLKEAIQGSNDVLASATTTLTLFPDTLTVDRAKVTVTRRTFFRSAEVMSMRIEDILNVTTTVGPYFGTVKIVSRVLNAEKPYTVGLFKRADATRIKRILQGYVIALQRDIDCSSLKTEELISMLDNLGEDNHPQVPSEESP